MTFDQHGLVKDSLSGLFEEIEQIRPTVIAIHGKSIHQTLQNEIATRHQIDWSFDCEHLAAVRWDFRGQLDSLVAFFRHPARGWLERDWELIITPTVAKINAELLRRRALRVGQSAQEIAVIRAVTIPEQCLWNNSGRYYLTHTCQGY
jgi:hypothetical protein